MQTNKHRPMNRIRTTIASLVATLLAAAVLATGAGSADAITIGSEAQPEWFPYFADIAVDGTSHEKIVCGATVIAPDWILTAAHCVDLFLTNPDAVGEFPDHRLMTPEDVDVRLRGPLTGEDGQYYPARELVLHPLWNGRVEDGHDLALVRIDAYATSGGGGFSPITPVRVGAPADPGAYQPGVLATMIGRGRYYRDVPSDRTLHYYETPILSDDRMDDVYNPWYGFDHWISEFMLGAGTSERTACDGDSGGPLVVSRNGVDTQVGVASFTDTWWDHCDEPGGYAELTGPQLAWVAARVPVVAQNWGGCTTDRGMPGAYQARYDYRSGGPAYAGEPMDGPFAWSITCHVPPPQPNTQPVPPTRGDGMGTQPGGQVGDSPQRPPSRGWDGQTAPTQHMEPQPTTSTTSPQPKPRPGTTMSSGTF